MFIHLLPFSGTHWLNRVNTDICKLPSGGFFLRLSQRMKIILLFRLLLWFYLLSFVTFLNPPFNLRNFFTNFYFPIVFINGNLFLALTFWALRITCHRGQIERILKNGRVYIITISLENSWKIQTINKNTQSIALLYELLWT